MFIKIVVVLLLLIVIISLLGGRLTPGAAGAPRPHAPTRPPLRTLMLRIAAVLVAIGVVLAALHLSGCSQPGETFHATDITGADFGRQAALTTLTDHRGRRPASADFSGKVVVVFFGYTQCPDICPTTLVALKEAMGLLGPEADRVQVLFVTVDPGRDTPALLAAYVPWFDTRFVGLYGDAKATLEIAREFRVFYSRVKGSTALDYSIDHSATSYAYDPQGRLRLLIHHGETPQHIAEDLHKLLAGK